MIKEKLDHIALSFYLVTGSSREPHKKKKKTTFLLLRIRLKQMDKNPEK